MKTENGLGSLTKTIPTNYDTIKPKHQRSPICPPTFEVNNGKKETEETFPKGNNQPIHVTDSGQFPPTEKISSQSEDPVAPKNLLNKSNLLERMEIEEPYPTKVKAKKSQQNPP